MSEELTGALMSLGRQISAPTYPREEASGDMIKTVVFGQYNTSLKINFAKGMPSRGLQFRIEGGQWQITYYGAASAASSSSVSNFVTGRAAAEVAAAAEDNYADESRLLLLRSSFSASKLANLRSGERD